MLLLLIVLATGYNTKWSDDEQDFVSPVIQTNIAKGNQLIIDSYDTFETVQTFISISAPKLRMDQVKR